MPREIAAHEGGKKLSNAPEKKGAGRRSGNEVMLLHDGVKPSDRKLKP